MQGSGGDYFAIWRNSNGVVRATKSSNSYGSLIAVMHNVYIEGGSVGGASGLDGGKAGDVLTKNSETDGDYAWEQHSFNETEQYTALPERPIPYH